MISSDWRKRIVEKWRRFELYPAPEALPRTRLFWIATGLVIFFALAFSVFFIVYQIGRQSAYLTSAEDMGIMDQAVWSLTHGHLFLQTICNTVSDVNCYGLNGVSRFAIHFEPILFPVSLSYFIWASPDTLLIIQVLVVASGAFPAFWLARLRLRNELAAAGIALLYLLYPAQQQATVFDFHAVTFTAALLLFTLYFMYTRRTAWMFVFAILSMACKEEIALVIVLFGLWSILFQHRWKSGGVLTLLGIGWLGLDLLIFHIFSPTGHPLLASRYSYLGSNPLQIAHTILRHPHAFLNQYVLNPSDMQYYGILFAPAGFLPLVAPWVLVLAVPSLAINVLSTDPNMRTGVFQYNAEIVPILIFATIEAIVLITWLVQWAIKGVHLLTEQVRSGRVSITLPRYSGRLTRVVLLVVLMGYVLFNVVQQDFTYGVLPFSQGFQWPQTTAHARLAQRFVDMIPPTASVSAQSSLVPHISHRSQIYLFPYDDNHADYIFLDVTGDTYPRFYGSYIHEVKSLLLGGNYGVVAAQDGYMLFKHGLASPGISPYSPVQSGDDVIPDLPDGFCSFVNVSQKQVMNPLQVDFTSTGSTAANVSLIGYSFAPPNMFPANVLTRYMQVTTYWKLNTASLPPLRIVALLLDKAGKEQYASVDFPANSWCPTTTWKPGAFLRLTSSVLYIGAVPKGITHVAIALIPLGLPFGSSAATQARLPLQVVHAPGSVTPVGLNALQLATFMIQ